MCEKMTFALKKNGRMGGFNYLSFVLHRNFQMITGSGGFVQCQIFIPIFWGDDPTFACRNMNRPCFLSLLIYI